MEAWGGEYGKSMVSQCQVLKPIQIMNETASPIKVELKASNATMLYNIQADFGAGVGKIAGTITSGGCDFLSPPVDEEQVENFTLLVAWC